MIFFSPSKPKPSTPSPEDKRIASLFDRKGGRLTMADIQWHLNRVPLYPHEREYVKAVLSKYEHPYSRFITKEEFYKALDEMAKNQKDAIDRYDIERIKRYF